MSDDKIKDIPSLDEELNKAPKQWQLLAVLTVAKPASDENRAQLRDVVSGDAYQQSVDVSATPDTTLGDLVNRVYQDGPADQSPMVMRVISDGEWPHRPRP